jgi:hypothetical protein
MDTQEEIQRIEGHRAQAGEKQQQIIFSRLVCRLLQTDLDYQQQGYCRSRDAKNAWEVQHDHVGELVGLIRGSIVLVELEPAAVAGIMPFQTYFQRQVRA